MALGITQPPFRSYGGFGNLNSPVGRLPFLQEGEDAASGALLSRISQQIPKQSGIPIAKNKNVNSPSLLKHLFASGAFVPTGGGAADIVKNIGSVINDRVAENIYPYGYSNAGPIRKGASDILPFLLSSGKKFINAGILGIKDPSRITIEKNPSSEDKARIDLINLYANNPQKYNSIYESEYAPTVGKEEGVKYYNSPVFENDLLSSLLSEDSINKLSKGVNSKQDLEKAIASGVKEKGDTGYSQPITGLGTASYSFGEDEKGPYMSYYDKWDLNPLHGKNSAISSGKGFDELVGGLYSSLSDANAPRIYNRIYFDKKTGKPLDREAEKEFNRISSGVREAKNAPITSGFSGLLKRKKK